MRYEDWPARLSKVWAENLKHSWGERDCALFAADCVDAQTGVDFAGGFRGRYKTRAGALRVLRAEIGDNQAQMDTLLPQIVSRYLPEITPVFAARGDIVMKAGEAGNFLACVMGRECIAPGPDGAAIHETLPALRAWRVE